MIELLKVQQETKLLKNGIHKFLLYLTILEYYIKISYLMVRNKISPYYIL